MTEVRCNQVATTLFEGKCSHYLEWLKLLGKLAGRGVCIDIENLAFRGFCETSQDGQSARTDGCLNSFERF